LQRLLLAISAGGVFTAGFAAGRATAPLPGAAPAPSASGAGYVRVKPGTHPPPPPEYNACYAAGTRTASLPCLPPQDPQLPMLLGQCDHPAFNISDGPLLGQYSGSPAVLCCYKAEMPPCSGRPLRIGAGARVASLRRGREGAWGSGG
jgi:hypothetical protein